MRLFDPIYILISIPAILLMMWAQYRLRSTYSAGMQIQTPLTGAAAAAHMLESAGVHDVGIEETPGQLSDHYDPSAKMLRLSPEVYRSRSATAVGIAAHEAGHALQHATGYLPLSLRSITAPAAQFGGTAFSILVMLGMILRQPMFILMGIVAFMAVCVFQIITLPVEFDASARAKRHLVDLGIVDEEGSAAVRKVLNAAALTYVAATLQSLTTVVYYIFRYTGGGSSDR